MTAFNLIFISLIVSIFIVRIGFLLWWLWFGWKFLSVRKETSTQGIYTIQEVYTLKDVEALTEEVILTEEILRHLNLGEDENAILQETFINPSIINKLASRLINEKLVSLEVFEDSCYCRRYKYTLRILKPHTIVEVDRRIPGEGC